MTIQYNITVHVTHMGWYPLYTGLFFLIIILLLVNAQGIERFCEDLESR